ncbi:hypothetical protein V493_07729, partial [Pseudogymnoascus sp. VKM F-4281 (FW-2241)]
GAARFGVDGVEIVEDWSPVLAPQDPFALSIPVNEEERNLSRSLSSFVDDKTPVVDDTPDTTRSPEVPMVAQGSAGPSAAGSSMVGAAREGNEDGGDDENEDGGDEDENGEGESTWMTEMQDLINEELGIVADVADGWRSPSLGYASPRQGLFIYDNCLGMW